MRFLWHKFEAEFAAQKLGISVGRHLRKPGQLLCLFKCGSDWAHSLENQPLDRRPLSGEQAKERKHSIRRELAFGIGLLPSNHSATLVKCLESRHA